MDIISRAQWGARYDDGFGPRPLPATQAWLHHSVTLAPDLVPPFDDDYAAIRELERIGENRFGRGISYTRLFTPAGLIFEGHSIGRVGSHTANRNTVAVGYCLVGNYETAAPTAAQLRAVAWCLQHDHTHGWLDAPRLDGGHRDLNATDCPGRHAYAAIPRINQLAAGGPIEEDDMPTAQEVANAVWAMAGWHPDKATGIKMFEQLAWTNHYANMVPGLVAAVAAIAADQNITPEQLAAAVDRAVAEHTPTAAQVAEAQRPFLAELVREVVPAEQAELIIQKLAEKLGTPVTGGSTS